VPGPLFQRHAKVDARSLKMKNPAYLINGTSLENVRNKYERIVIDLMKKLIPGFPDFDNCSICLEDVYALSLSRIPSTYVNPERPRVETDETVEDLTEIVRYAIYHVSAHAKH